MSLGTIHIGTPDRLDLHEDVRTVVTPAYAVGDTITVAVSYGDRRVRVSRRIIEVEIVRNGEVVEPKYWIDLAPAMTQLSGVYGEDMAVRLYRGVRKIKGMTEWLRDAGLIAAN